MSGRRSGRAANEAAGDVPVEAAEAAEAAEEAAAEKAAAEKAAAERAAAERAAAEKATAEKAAAEKAAAEKAAAEKVAAEAAEKAAAEKAALRTIVVYDLSTSGNIGDVIQSVALARLIDDPLVGVLRSELSVYPPTAPRLLVNGYHEKNEEVGICPAAFVGIHIPSKAEKTMAWAGMSNAPIGTRDSHTQYALWHHGIESGIVGCATATLSRYNGPRRGSYRVDAKGKPWWPAIAHTLSRADVLHGDCEEMWSIALGLLETYRTAASVFTNRLHVALPCLAFGTPVCIYSPGYDGRFSLLHDMKVPLNTLYLSDERQMAEWKDKFIGHLRLLGVRVREHEVDRCPPSWVTVANGEGGR